MWKTLKKLKKKVTLFLIFFFNNGVKISNWSQSFDLWLTFVQVLLKNILSLIFSFYFWVYNVKCNTLTYTSCTTTHPSFILHTMCILALTHPIITRFLLSLLLLCSNSDFTSTLLQIRRENDQKGRKFWWEFCFWKGSGENCWVFIKNQIQQVIE